ncbi:tRNA epoxyqueuosine(34) reductase QueG [Macrococcoides canis]|uniref:tRNA epoxyqueuosine(34) reductase QueG n=1 Tax=Macrococcoides canis TaxID=1855823 RepID=UPI001F36F6AC|nr:tRNA epoxyqueuosine(34) reductase QueG [Macrococcus canis]UJS27314.1 tRNA epoxyqueuosine(34) reductase QueG [Macrococcus canis]UTG99631.1 tRNA epoxyqueuosine(34) reductase QueG [Macrococcus canis]WBF53368.1 tRNA epoxyqueuosine(34) reductase QueG [Macrococcus canis]
MNEQLKQEIIAYSKTIGIDAIGFTTAEPFHELRPKLEAYYSSGYASGFEKGSIEERIDPKLSLPEAESIIAIAVGYPNKLPNAPKSIRGARRGIFARASWGIDYHTLLNKRLSLLEAFILERVPDAKVMNMVDTGVLSDRAVAERAGLGYAAKNGFILNKTLGTWTYLGEMLISIPFTPDNAVIDSCLDCTICIDRCPTGALLGDGQLDSNKCISFLTQTKGFMPDEYRGKIGNRLYGCDTCQQVCPKNRGINTMHDDIELEPETLKPLLVPLLKMNNKQFKNEFGHLAGAWRGKKPIQRNAILALAHFKEIDAIDDLKEIAENDVRPEIKGTAYWALGQISSSTHDYLRERYTQETDNDVKIEILKSLGSVE